MPTKKRVYSVTPIDPVLRADALRTIEAYRTGKMRVASTPPHFLGDLVPKVMKTLSGLIAAHERGELSPSLQKKLVTQLKETVRDYPCS
jgi:hypothetical protein